MVIDNIGGISTQARALPLLVLADVSSSMSGEKIASLNQGFGISCRTSRATR